MSGAAAPRARLSNVGAIAVVLAATLPYLVALRGPFVFDDENDIVTHAANHAVWPPEWAFGARPLTSLTFAIEWATFGARPWAFRIVNVVIHVATALALRSLVRAIATREGVARPLRDHADALSTWTALLWASHPLATSAVTYVVHRYESLASMFYVLALLALIRAHDATIERRRWTTWLGLAAFAAVASKEIAVTLPVAGVLLDRAFLSGSLREAWRRNRALHATTFVTATATFFATLQPRALGTSQGLVFKSLTPIDYARSELGVFAHYLRLIVWPRGLCIDYFDWPIARRLGDVMPAAAVTLVLLAASIALLVRAPRVGFVAGWMWLLLAPTSTVVPLFGELVAERRLYLALAAPAVLVAMGIVLAQASPLASRVRVWGVRAGGAAIVVALASACALRNATYRTATGILGDNARARPNNARVCANYGNALRDEGALDRAVTEYRRCIALDFKFMSPYASLARVAYHLRFASPWVGEARVDLAALEAARDRGNALIATADAQMQRGDRAGARATLREAAAADPYSSAAFARIAMSTGLSPDLTRAAATETIVAGLRAWALDDALDPFVGAALTAAYAKLGDVDHAINLATQVAAAADAAGLTELAESQRRAADRYAQPAP